jgi:hypothetical protein
MRRNEVMKAVSRRARATAFSHAGREKRGL